MHDDKPTAYPKVSPLAHPVEIYMADTRKILADLSRYIDENFGARCPDKDNDCPCCKMWSLHDQIVQITQ